MKQYEGKLIVHTGSMFSGKTSALLEDLRRFEIAGYKVILFKPAIDNRYAENKVKTHIKNYYQDEKEAISIEFIEDVKEYNVFNDYDVIGFDEIQFFKSNNSINNETGIVSWINILVNKYKKTVIVAGLDLDYKATPFENVKELLPLADYVQKHHAVCVECGNDAWVSHKLAESNERIEVGGTEKYVPLCRKCYYNKIKKY